MPDKPNQFDALFDVILQKDVSEAILKNLVWFIALATLLRLIPVAVQAEEYLFIFLAVVSFIFLFFLNLAYGVNQVLVPIDKGLGGHLMLIKDLNKLSGQTDASRLGRVYRFLFLTRVGLLYFVFSFLYLWMVFTLMGLLLRHG